MSKPPKKFTDETQTKIRDEWLDWYARRVETIKPELEAHVMFFGQPLENYWPEDYDKDVGEGDWIVVVEEPHTELKQRFTVPTPSLWWARPDTHRPHAHDIGTKSFPKVVPGPYRVVIETPGGSLWLFPHEYVKCHDPLPLITDPEVTIHPLGGNVTLDEEKQEQMFYLQSRGWSRQDALLTLMEGVDMRDWGWCEFPEYAMEVFSGVGTRLRIA
jgi:hypothetical protein